MKNRTVNRKLIICVLVILLGVAGCSLFGGERGDLEQKLKKFVEADKRVFGICQNAEDKGTTVDKNELDDDLAKMRSITEEFQDKAKQSKDKDLRKEAAACYRGMNRIMKGYHKYITANEHYLMFKDSVVKEFAYQAKIGKQEAFRKLSKDRYEGLRTIDRSGL